MATQSSNHRFKIIRRDSSPSSCFKINSAELFPLICPNYHLLFFFLVFKRAIQQILFLSLPKLLTSLAICTLPLFYLMFLGDWRLKHLACCPISVRSGGCFWAGGISGAGAPLLEIGRCNCIHPSNMFLTFTALETFTGFPSFLYNYFSFALTVE